MSWWSGRVFSAMAEKVQYVEQNVNATYAVVKLTDDTIVALLEVCQCRRPLCLLQHGDGNCKITVTRKKTTRKRTPYCFVCKHQKHFLDALADQVRMLCLFLKLIVLVFWLRRCISGSCVYAGVPMYECMHACRNVLCRCVRS